MHNFTKFLFVLPLVGTMNSCALLDSITSTFDKAKIVGYVQSNGTKFDDQQFTIFYGDDYYLGVTTGSPDIFRIGRTYKVDGDYYFGTSVEFAYRDIEDAYGTIFVSKSGIDYFYCDYDVEMSSEGYVSHSLRMSTYYHDQDELDQLRVDLSLSVIGTNLVYALNKVEALLRAVDLPALY